MTPPPARTASLSRIGLAIPTVGRSESLHELLLSVAAGTWLPEKVVVADQSGGRLVLETDLPFRVEIIPSRGGASAGRNDALRRLRDEVDYVAFPNDDSRFEPLTLQRVVDAFQEFGEPAALAGTYLDGAQPRYRLPPRGTVLDTRSAWRAIEPGMFVSAEALDRAVVFDEQIGTGSPTPWQAGEGTDLLLRFIAEQRRVISVPDVRVIGRGERRDLSEPEYRAKVRAYARGTGYVYRRHSYGTFTKLRLVVAPWVRLALSGRVDRRGLRVAWSSSLGRLEGVLARTLGEVRHLAR